MADPQNRAAYPQNPAAYPQSPAAYPDPDYGAYPYLYEENEGEEEEQYLGAQDDLGRLRHKRLPPPFKPRGLDYTMKEDRPVYFLGLEKDMMTAKAYLQHEERAPNPMIVYDHLTAVIDKLVLGKPANAGDVFEEYCRTVRISKFYPCTDHLQEMYVPPQFTESEKVLRLLKSVQRVPSTADLVSEDIQEVNMMDTLKYFERMGVALPRLETFLIRIKLQSLSKAKRLKSYRFWGKIHGIYNDYVIAETEQFQADIDRMIAEQQEEERRKQEEQDRLLKEQHELLMKGLEGGLDQKEDKDMIMSKFEASLDEKAAAKKKAAELAGEEYDEGEEEEERPKLPPEFPPLPQSTFQKPPEAPPEQRGVGPNRKVYYVYSKLEDEWLELPDVTPQQIQIARKIRKFFTGDLDAQINSYPPFPGKEINLLRAQIARISAMTSVSPKGYFKIEGTGGDEEEEEEEEEEAADEEDEEGGGARGPKGPVIENPSFRPKPVKFLMQLNHWVHHQVAILEQGRSTFWRPEKERAEGEEEEVEEELEEEEEGEGAKSKERAPPLFRNLIKDKCPLVKRLWTLQAAGDLLPETAFVFIRSELWPGYFAFCAGSKYDAQYVGWGLKYSPFNYSVPAVPVIQTEYPQGPEIMEMTDPTWAQEEAWRLAHTPKVKPMPSMLGEGEEDEEEEEEEETEGGDSDED